jgi:hypothetical protein
LDNTTASRLFIDGLERGDLRQLRTVPKGDLHHHSWMGGRLSYVEERLGVHIEPPPTEFPTFEHLLRWNLGTFLPHIYEPEVREVAVEAAFVQAAADGVAVLATSFGALMLDRLYGNDVAREAAAFRRLHAAYAPQVELRPLIGLNRASDPDVLLRLLDAHLEDPFWVGIDLYGDEFARPVRAFKVIYRRAREGGLRLTAHVGEYGDAAAVVKAVNELELDEVQHGIAAAGSPAAMRYLADHDIQLNVCPTSNVRLRRARDYRSHPIRRLYDHGVRVTVNTDDVVFFDQGVSDEFLNLYRSGAWRAEELDEIRRNGLVSCGTTDRHR